MFVRPSDDGHLGGGLHPWPQGIAQLWMGLRTHLFKTLAHVPFLGLTGAPPRCSHSGWAHERRFPRILANMSCCLSVCGSGHARRWEAVLICIFLTTRTLSMSCRVGSMCSSARGGRQGVCWASHRAGGSPTVPALPARGSHPSSMLGSLCCPQILRC